MAGSEGTWKSATNIIAMIALGVAVLALVVSIESCSIAKDAYDLGKKEYVSARTTTYKASITNDKKFFTLIAADQSLQLQYAKICFPATNHIGSYTITPPKYDFPIYEIDRTIKENAVKQFPRVGGCYKIIDSAILPVVIESNFIAKGNSYVDKSIYHVMYSVNIPDDEKLDVSVDIKGLVFAAHDDSSLPAEDLLLRYLQQKEILDNNGLKVIEQVK